MATDKIPTPEGMGPYRARVGSDLDDAGLQVDGYIDKKGLTAQNALDTNFRYNMTPPGMWIEDQNLADIRSMPMKQVTAMDYGDGWEGESDRIPM